MFSEEKVFRLGKIVEKIHKRVMVLELQVKANTPPVVLKEKIKATVKVATNIKEV